MTMKQMKEKVFRGVLSLLLLVACAVPASAAQKRPKTKGRATGTDSAAARPAADAACPADDGVGRAGLRAFIDPQTGQLRQPTPEEAAQLAAEIHASRLRALSELEVVVHPDGMKSVDLKDAFLIDVVARRNPDGSLSIGCLPPGASGPPPPAARPAAPVLEER
jgi:hypothetical protein